MTHFVLVHGAWHGPWCWSFLTESLRDNGHTATAVELPSDDPTAGAEQYARVIAHEVNDTGSVVVGHSMSGLALPLVPALANVSALIYLAALLPEPGRSWRDQLTETRPMADWFYANALPEQCRDDQGRTEWPSHVAEQLFFHDCEPDVRSRAAQKLRPQAATPVAEISPVEQFASVPSYYVMGREDRAVSRTWAAGAAADRLGVSVRWIDGAHSPFLARPAELARTLAALATEPVQDKIP